ncbi:hypothetical protein ABPG72_003763 [Tetrahymena utriculariae]
MINLSAQYEKFLTQKKDLFKVIDQSLYLLDQQLYLDQNSQITSNQYQFVFDYLVSIYQVDHKQKQLVFEKIEQLISSSQQFTRNDLKYYLINTLSGIKKRVHDITIDELLEYFSIKQILIIEDYWIDLKDQGIHFMTKEMCIEFIRFVIQKYNVDYSQVGVLVQKSLEKIHKFVFFEDSVSILLQIAIQLKDLNLLLMNISDQINEQSVHRKESIKLIEQSFEQVSSQFNTYDSKFLSYLECLFVIDYLFSIYEADEIQKQSIREHVKSMSLSKKYNYYIKKDEFKIYLTNALSGLTRRETNIKIEDLIKYIDTKLIMEIERYWQDLKEQKNIQFISKDESIQLIQNIIQKYRIDYSEVCELVDNDLQELHKFVFFEDFISILLKIAKKHNFYKKKYTKQHKQDCGCQIF